MTEGGLLLRSGHCWVDALEAVSKSCGCIGQASLSVARLDLGSVNVLPNPFERLDFDRRGFPAIASFLRFRALRGA